MAGGVAGALPTGSRSSTGRRGEDPLRATVGVPFRLGLQTLPELAEHAYGTPLFWERIRDANAHLIIEQGGVELIPPGAVLTIPPLDADPDAGWVGPGPRGRQERDIGSRRRPANVGQPAEEMDSARQTEPPDPFLEA